MPHADTIFFPKHFLQLIEYTHGKSTHLEDELLPLNMSDCAGGVSYHSHIYTHDNILNNINNNK